MMIAMITNNKHQRESNKNVVQSPKDLENRYCNHCHTMLVHDEIHNIFKCQTCGVSTLLANTQPDVKIKTNFPTYSPTEPNRLKIMQSDKERLSRSEYFIQKNMKKRNEIEDNDPHLKILRSRNDLHITSTEYYSHADDDHLYD